MSVPACTSPVSPVHRALSIHLIFDGVLDCLEPADRIRCARTCRGLYDAVKGYDRRTYNVNRWLRRFFRDPIGFRSLQAQFGMLISGSAALQFMDRTHYPDSDLDIYVCGGHDARQVGRWLQHTEQYRFTPSRRQNAEFDNLDWIRYAQAPPHIWQAVENDVDLFQHQHYRFKGVFGVFTFKKDMEQRDGGVVERKVQVIAVTRCPLWTVLNFHNTCVMNFLTYDAAYSLYPRATFQERTSLCMSVVPSAVHLALEKYTVRGWRLLANIHPHMVTEPAPFYPNQTRWVNNRYSWVVPLDTTGLQPRRRKTPTSEEMTFDPVICNSWRLRTFPAHFNHDPTLPPCRMATDHVVRSSVLQYTYLVADRILYDVLFAFLMQQGRLEHMKADHLPPRARDMVWTWWDAALKSIVDLYRQNGGGQFQAQEGGVMDVD